VTTSSQSSTVVRVHAFLNQWPRGVAHSRVEYVDSPTASRGAVKSLLLTGLGPEEVTPHPLYHHCLSNSLLFGFWKASLILLSALARCSPVHMASSPPMQICDNHSELTQAVRLSPFHNSLRSSVLPNLSFNSQIKFNRFAGREIYKHVLRSLTNIKHVPTLLHISRFLHGGELRDSKMWENILKFASRFVCHSFCVYIEARIVRARRAT
jgi:hypothetical protein